VSLLTVQRWVKRAGDTPLGLVDFSDISHAAHHVANKTEPTMEERVFALRGELATDSDLGEYGAAAIHQALVESGEEDVPATRTIHRILERGGLLDRKRRVRRPAPPRGWYLPEVAMGRAEVDQFDVVQGLVIEGGTDVEVLNGVSVLGGLIASFVTSSVTSAFVRECLVSHWRTFGLPAYAQFDNDTRFQGQHQFQDTVGTVTRLCLGLGVVPVFAPVREPGLQNAVESLNGRWQEKVWERFHHETIQALVAQSDRYVAAARKGTAKRQEEAPQRRAFPADWTFQPKDRPRGRIIYVRRTNEHGEASLLGHTFHVAAHWAHRLVRCEVDLDHHHIQFFGLRRREPAAQPLLGRTEHRLPITFEDD
jgi:hypothetical protein